MDEVFGKYRVTLKGKMTNGIYTSEEHNRMINEIADWCIGNVRTMSSYPGTRAGETVWCFEDEEDLLLFTLRWS